MTKENLMKDINEVISRYQNLSAVELLGVLEVCKTAIVQYLLEESTKD